MSTTSQILSLYRSILREAKKIPTYNKRHYVLKRTKHEFRLFKIEFANLCTQAEVNAVKIQEQIMFAEDSLDNIKVQAEHLNSILEREPDELPKVEKFVAKENKK